MISRPRHAEEAGSLSLCTTGHHCCCQCACERGSCRRPGAQAQSFCFLRAGTTFVQEEDWDGRSSEGALEFNPGFATHSLSVSPTSQGCCEASFRSSLVGRWAAGSAGGDAEGPRFVFIHHFLRNLYLKSAPGPLFVLHCGFISSSRPFRSGAAAPAVRTDGRRWAQRAELIHFTCLRLSL